MNSLDDYVAKDANTLITREMLADIYGPLADAGRLIEARQDKPETLKLLVQDARDAGGPLYKAGVVFPPPGPMPPTHVYVENTLKAIKTAVSQLNAGVGIGRREIAAILFPLGYLHARVTA